MNKQSPHLTDLLSSLSPLREKIMEHKIYSSINSLDHLVVFMEHHVFAVWDFMSLLKKLQVNLTCTQVPWVPPKHSLACRLINEIVVAEESDEMPEGGYASHFDLYRKAMLQCGANTSAIDKLSDLISEGVSLLDALDRANVPAAAKDFVRTTWSIVETNASHRIAAALTLGREDIIPEMFESFVADLHSRYPEKIKYFRDYLERHIYMDAEQHRPMSFQMMESLCDCQRRLKSAAIWWRCALDNDIRLQVQFSTNEKTTAKAIVSSV